MQAACQVPKMRSHDFGAGRAVGTTNPSHKYPLVVKWGKTPLAKTSPLATETWGSIMVVSRGLACVVNISLRPELNFFLGGGVVLFSSEQRSDSLFA